MRHGLNQTLLMDDCLRLFIHIPRKYDIWMVCWMKYDNIESWAKCTINLRVKCKLNVH